MIKNVGVTDRTIRIIAGLLFILIGSAASGVLLQIILILVGLVALVTGFLGSCPVYKQLGWDSTEKGPSGGSGDSGGASAASSGGMTSEQSSAGEFASTATSTPETAATAEPKADESPAAGGIDDTAGADSGADEDNSNKP